MRNSGIFLILAFDLKQICLFIVFLSIQRLQTNDGCNLSRKAVCVLVHFRVSLWKHQIVWVRYARMFEHTSVCIVCMCKNVDYIYSYLDVCRFVCTLHILCVQWIVWVGLCVCVATPGSHLREWSAAACLSLAEAPKGRRIRERENERVQHRRERGHAARPPGYLLQPIKGWFTEHLHA